MKNKYLEIVEKSQLEVNFPQFYPGDIVIVNVWVKEGNKARVQAFKGFVLSKKKRGINSAFTVRKISFGEGIERTFQKYSPIIDSVQIERRAKVRRAKLYYMRSLTGKAARIKERV